MKKKSKWLTRTATQRTITMVRSEIKNKSTKELDAYVNDLATQWTCRMEPGQDLKPIEKPHWDEAMNLILSKYKTIKITPYEQTVAYEAFQKYPQEKWHVLSGESYI